MARPVDRGKDVLREALTLKAFRELRVLTRYRRILIGQRSRVRNRVHKVTRRGQMRADSAPPLSTSLCFLIRVGEVGDHHAALRKLRIPVKVITRSTLNVIIDSTQSDRLTERSDAGVRL